MTRMGDERKKMDDRDNALGDRFNKAPVAAPRDPRLSPAEARADAERRLHEAWLSETARQQPAKAGEVPPVPQVPAVDPRMQILGQHWETISDDPKWVAPQLPDLTHTQPDAAEPAVRDWTLPAEAPARNPFADPEPWPVAPPFASAPVPQFAPEPAPQLASAPVPQFAPQPAPQLAKQYVAQPAPQYAPPPPYYSQPTQPHAASVAQYVPQQPQQYAPQPQQYAPQQQPQYAPQQPQQYAPQQYAPQPAPQYAPQQYAPQQPQQYAPQYTPQSYAPQYAPQFVPQPSPEITPVAPQRAPSFPPSDDDTLRGGVVENLEFARLRVEELRKLQEWRLGQERRISEEIGRRNALAEQALTDDIQARREAEELRLEQWKAESRAQFERDLAREEAEFERRLADRRREQEVELEARLLRRIDDAARRAEALERARIEQTSADPRLYVVRDNTG